MEKVILNGLGKDLLQLDEIEQRVAFTDGDYVVNYVSDFCTDVYAATRNIMGDTISTNVLR